MNVSTDRRRELAGERVTVNGRPAVIGGVRNDYATVTDLATGMHAEWSWPTVEHIVAVRGGAFRL